ncbi:Erg28-like protein [Glomus cerebriforme]|uniref:Erg28-like protein n=1 Tax=Glomus cerebriforme TaxID=658196 RepID=A0A397TKL7_9GLOM|nr:Erg28-like protein [Glomus cerebriforme]
MLPDSAGGYLAYWMLFVSILAIFNTIQNFVTLSLTKRVYSARPDQVTALTSRTFAIWTLLSAIIRIYAAYNITEVNIYQIAIWTYIIAWSHFISEFLIFKSTKISAGWLSPVIVSTLSLTWMLLQYNYYTQQNFIKY